MAFPNIMGHNETPCNTASHCDTCCLKMVRENNLKTRENPEIRIYGRPAIVGYPRPMHYHTSTVGYLDCKSSFQGVSNTAIALVASRFHEAIKSQSEHSFYTSFCLTDKTVINIDTLACEKIKIETFNECLPINTWLQRTQQTSIPPFSRIQTWMTDVFTRRKRGSHFL